MNLLLIGPFPPTKIPEADKAIHLAARLAARGLGVHVLTGRDGIPPPGAAFTVHAHIRTWAWRDLLPLTRLLRRHPFDVVLLMYHAGLYNGHPMTTFIPTVSKRLRPHTRVVSLFEDAWGAFQHGLATRAIRKAVVAWAGSVGVDYGFGTLLRDSDRLIMVSERVKRRLARRRSGVEDKSVVIPTPALVPMASEGHEAARQAMRTALSLQPEDALLVYLGYLYPGKGVEFLLEALALIRNEGRRLHLLVVGGSLNILDSPAYTASLRAAAARLGVASRVTWTGEYAWDSEMPSRALRAADLCVLPFDEGVHLDSTSLAAAATHGVPIITTESDTLENIFHDRTNVYLCPPKNPGALARAIERLLGDAGLRRHLSAGAEALAAECYDWKYVIDRTLDVISR